MIENNSNIKHNSKKTITAILLAVIVLLLICILVKSFTKNDNDKTINNNITTSPEVQSPTEEPSRTDGHNATTGLPTDIIGSMPPEASASITTPGATHTSSSAPTLRPTPTVRPTQTIKPTHTATPKPTTTPKPTEKPTGATPNAFTDESFPTRKDSNGVYSKYAYMIDLETHKVVYEKNADLAMYPASMTKIMTVLVALENIDNYKVKITMDSDFYAYLTEEGASVAGFVAGEKVTAEMLLYGAMLVSGAECCIQLARFVAGSEEAFYIMMNDKAKELGMKNTHFNSTTGLFNKDNYTTAHDVAILLEYAIKNEQFYKIMTAKKYVGAETNKKPDGFTLQNLVLKNADNYVSIRNGKFIGGKTGYIMKAGNCLASLAEINGRKYILVTAGANKALGSMHFVDADYIYNNFKNF